jgi:hypothetical protein
MPIDPDARAVEVSNDDLFVTACAAVEFTLPLYEMARMRSATGARLDATGRPAGKFPESTYRWANQWVHTPKLLGPHDRHVVSPNNDTLYSSAWFDLRDGPVLIRVPAMPSRYYVLGLLDMYTNPFGYIGSRTTGNEAGTFLLHGPGWSGEVPEGARAVACPTNTVWLIGRILVDGEADLAAAVALQSQLAIEAVPGSGAPVPSLIDAAMQPVERIGDPSRFAAIVNRVLASDPPPHDAREAVARFAECGIGPDSPDTLTEAQRDALARAIAYVTQALAAAAPAALGGGWNLPVKVSESFGADYHARAHVALKYIGALGVEEAMYVVADRDADGALLEGESSYVLRFAPGCTPQTGAFWSLTAYDAATCLLAENARGRYSIGDRTRGLVFDPDGGLRIAISASEPDDPTLRENWLPVPEGRFYVALRLYAAQATHIDGTYRYPPIVRQRAAS